uniref:(northern house mosquito) hypothetical protein n=1 Tax=Culex pipiens TaxID=7175 RepID=A0A8D8AAC4_CULPI
MFSAPKELLLVNQFRKLHLFAKIQPPGNARIDKLSLTFRSLHRTRLCRLIQSVQQRLYNLVQRATSIREIVLPEFPFVPAFARFPSLLGLVQIPAEALAYGNPRYFMVTYFIWWK